MTYAMLALALLLARAAPASAQEPPPPAAPAGDGVTSPMICGVDWFLEDGWGNPLPCPDGATPTPEPALRARQWLPIVGR